MKEKVSHIVLFRFFLFIYVFSVSLCVQQWGKGQKEREVLGTSSQWVALSGHCPSATVSNVKGGEIGDGVAEHVLILKDCHQTNPVEGRTTPTTISKNQQGKGQNHLHHHFTYHIHSFIHLFTYSFHTPMWLPRGTCHITIRSKTLHPSHQTRVFVLVAPRISTATNHTNHHPFFYIKESRHHLMLPYHSIIAHFFHNIIIIIVREKKGCEMGLFWFFDL